jgi:hypothetical protein
MSHDNFRDEEIDGEEDEELDSLLGSVDEAPGEVHDHAEIVREVQQAAKNGLPEKERWHPSGPCFRAESADTEKMFAVNGKMVPESELQASQEDPELYTFLFEKQKAGLQPDPEGCRICGGDPRDPDLSELESAIGRVCPFCGEKITEDETQVRNMGSLVFYEAECFHWEHLALMALLVCKGHYQQAAEKYHLPLEDLRAMRTLEFRSLSWGRLGYVRGGQ